MFGVITKAFFTSEERLFTEKSAPQESNENNDISDMDLVKSKNHPAVVFTKQTLNETFRNK